MGHFHNNSCCSSPQRWFNNNISTLKFHYGKSVTWILVHQSFLRFSICGLMFCKALITHIAPKSLPPSFSLSPSTSIVKIWSADPTGSRWSQKYYLLNHHFSNPKVKNQMTTGMKIHLKAWTIKCNSMLSVCFI